MNHTLVPDELDVLVELLPTPGTRVIELGCGGARMARQMLQRWPDMRYLGLEVDLRQHAINLQDTPPRMRFAVGGAQAIACDDAQFDLALMLKSLHHVPLDAMDQALTEVARVLRPGGHLYVSEPVYEGALNEIVRLYNDEGIVRAAAQAALDRALAVRSTWEQVAQRRFDMPVHFEDFAQFERRMMNPTFADHRIDAPLRERVAAAFAPHCSMEGAHFVRPMHVRLLRRVG
ncbi:MAG: class I SAM-dependent methyltransferase [Acidovorax sp.]|uniref:class I SAM-dependent methyltransferase n=1 Tax=Diaphorobacter sp. TaxID=1934310 RepID=UPI000DB15897|nr:class I SAM-dependent methyltransferase [Diaphorobacter sp.]PZU35882.1 MAG: class I SAM-dependent methyltransferase [Acidovorax sp.]